MQTIKCIHDYSIEGEGTIKYGTILTELPQSIMGIQQYRNELGEIFYFDNDEISYSNYFWESFRLISNE